MSAEKITVQLPSPLLSYTGGQSELESQGPSLTAVLADLDGRYPGLRFRVVDERGRIREHIRFFVNGSMVTDVAVALKDGDVVFVMAALSGG